MLDPPGLRPGLNEVEVLPVWATSADIVAVRRKPVWILRSFVPAKQPRLARIESANENYTAAWTSIYMKPAKQLLYSIDACYGEMGED